jgi:hypothetical protein
MLSSTKPDDAELETPTGDQAVLSFAKGDDAGL